MAVPCVEPVAAEANRVVAITDTNGATGWRPGALGTEVDFELRARLHSTSRCNSSAESLHPR